ncbi:MAG: hypothetical protein NZ570_06180 [Candidatus Caldarchaeum sp.]|nr:hypothetical protein [Candidatus Caldarchaeum sp.]MDW8360155.1 hypothetical protein [Candidatus Caldarchaeum sp.]
MAEGELQRKLKELIIDEEELSAALVDRARRFIRLTRDGRVVLMIPKDKLPLRSQILLYLMGKRLARELGLVEKDVASIEEISGAVGAEYFSVAARLKELKDQYMVLAVERGGYTVQLAKLQELLDSVEKSITPKS